MRLLAWYDAHGRDLPWRVKGGLADPYRVWLSEVMLQQTTVAAVKAYFARFTTLWPTVQALAAAPDDEVMREWAGLGYYARARNLLACAREVAATGFPSDLQGLRALPGIGPYTAAAVASIAFGRPETVVDGNVERVVSRLFRIETPLPQSRPAIFAATASLTPQDRPGDFAQAMMDLGATICTPRAPACTICPLVPLCQGREIASLLPVKAAKPPKPTRQGTVWVLRSGENWLLERRPPKGLLGGLLAFPSTGWDGSDHPPPALALWQEAGEVRHTFTHFHLVLRVLVANATTATRGEFHGPNAFSPQDLPTLMRKAHHLALRHTDA